MSRVARSHHAACHAEHVRDWPMHAKVFITWGIQGWVPGVVVGYCRNRVLVRVTGRAQSGMDMTWFIQRRKRDGSPRYAGRSPNNIIARRGGFPPKYQPKYQPPSCLAMSREPHRVIETGLRSHHEETLNA